MKTIVIANQKGGVGKTMLSAALAGALSEQGKKILVIDMDAQGSLSSMLTVQPEAIEQGIYNVLVDELAIEQVMQRSKVEYVYLVPSTKSMKGLEFKLAADPLDAVYLLRDALNEVKDNFDIILIDTPPKLDTATRMALVAADGVMIPIECQQFAFDATGEMLDEIETVKKRVNKNLKMLGFVINKFTASRKIEQMYNKALRHEYKNLVFTTEFRNAVQYTESCTLGLPITHTHPRSIQAQAVRNLVAEFTQAVAA